MYMGKLVGRWFVQIVSKNPQWKNSRHLHTIRNFRSFLVNNAWLAVKQLCTCVTAARVHVTYTSRCTGLFKENSSSQNLQLCDKILVLSSWKRRKQWLNCPHNYECILQLKLYTCSPTVQCEILWEKCIHGVLDLSGNRSSATHVHCGFHWRGKEPLTLRDVVEYSRTTAWNVRSSMPGVEFRRHEFTAVRLEYILFLFASL